MTILGATGYEGTYSPKRWINKTLSRLKQRRKPSADLRQDGLRHSSKEEETSTFAQQFKPHKPSAKAEVGEGK